MRRVSFFGDILKDTSKSVIFATLKYSLWRGLS
jgi:hypothetical protein